MTEQLSRLPHTVPDPSDVDAFLACCVLFDGQDPASAAPLAAADRWRLVAGGTRLLDEGDEIDVVVVVAFGRLRVSCEGAGGFWHPIAEIGPGDAFGEGCVLGETRNRYRVDAVRDSEVVLIERDKLLAWMAGRPQQWQALAARALRLAAAAASPHTHVPTHSTVAILPADPSVPVGAFVEGLARALASHGAVTTVDASTFEAQLGIAGISADDDRVFDQVDRLALRWIDRLGERHRFVILQGHAGFDAWTRRCVRQSDSVLVVARSDGDPTPSGAERELFYGRRGPSIVDRDLVLLHTDDVEVPEGTADWMAGRPGLHRPHHVRLGREGDLRHLARLLTGTSVGLVLGGGGARGNAHIGVIRALRELGVPIDLIGGTSAGGGIAAMVACERSSERMMSDSRVAFVEKAPFHAFDVPYMSLIQKHAAEAPARWLFGERNIEDLWIPYFCISADIASGDKVVHKQGRVWKGVRATSALPGVLPPQFHRGRVLVDGGVTDNTPISTMMTQHDGANIVVDVSPPDPALVGPDVVDLPRNRDVLLAILHPLLRPPTVPTIASVVVRTMTLTSARTGSAADLLILPEIADYGIVDFEAMDELVALGYNATMASFEARRGDVAFLRRFHLTSLPERLPRVPVPVWQGVERRRRAVRRRLQVQALALAIIGALLGLGLHSVVISEVFVQGAAIGAVLFGCIPLAVRALAGGPGGADERDSA